MKKDLEMFFHADIVGTIFGLTANLLCIYDAQMLGYHSSCTYLDVLGKLSLSKYSKLLSHENKNKLRQPKGALKNFLWLNGLKAFFSCDNQKWPQNKVFSYVNNWYKRWCL